MKKLCVVLQRQDPESIVSVAQSTHVGGCQNYDPFWGTLNIRCRIIIGIQKGTIILTTTHVLNALSQSDPMLQGT